MFHLLTKPLESNVPMLKVFDCIYSTKDCREKCADGYQEAEDEHNDGRVACTLDELANQGHPADKATCSANGNCERSSQVIWETKKSSPHNGRYKCNWG